MLFLKTHFMPVVLGMAMAELLKRMKQFAKFLAYTLEEMIGISIKEIFVAADSNYTEYLDERNTNGKAKADLTGIRKNGERFPCEISSIVFTDDTGERRTINIIRGTDKKYNEITNQV